MRKRNLRLHEGPGSTASALGFAGRIVFEAVSDLVDLTYDDVAPGYFVEADGYGYLVVEPGSANAGLLDHTGTGGVKLQALPGSDGWCGVEAVGAIGNGSTDDTAAWQRAIDSGLPIVGKDGAIYKITASLDVPDNVQIDMNGSRFRRGWESGSPILQNTTAITTWSNSNIRLLNMWAEDDTGCRGPFCRMVGVSDLRIDGFRWECHEAYTEGDRGAFGLEVSGENIVLSNFNIDSYDGGQNCDGIHPLWVKNLTLTNFIIHSGDDALGLSFRDQAWGNTGEHRPSENVYIGGGVVSSAMANAVRVGCDDRANANQVWKNVTIENIVIGGDRDMTGGRYITLEDRRPANGIIGKNDGIVIRNVRARDPGAAGFIQVAGNPDVTDGTNQAQHNFKKVILDNVESEHDEAGYWFYGGGMDELQVNAGRFAHNATQTSTFAEFYDIGHLEFRNLKLKPQTTGVAANFKWCSHIELLTPEIQGSGSEFALLRLDVRDALVAPRLRIYGGYLRNAARLIGLTGSNPIAEVLVFGTDMADVSSPTISSEIEPITAIYTVIPAREVAYSDGTTGGTRSASVGAQYVELTIGGITYKVLHDGTI